MGKWRYGDLTAVAAIALGTAVAVAGSSFAVRFLRTAHGQMGAPVPPHHHRFGPGMRSRAPAAPLAPSAPTAPHLPAGVAFYASSLGAGLAFEGDYSGRLTWDGSALEVDIPLAMVRRESVGGPPTYLAGIALALVEDADTPQGWRMVRRGRLHLATGAFHVGADTWLRHVHLRLDGLKDEDLEGRRLIIIQQLDVEDATGSHPAWTYTQADRSLLARLMGGILGGC
jgi:hypothetical protein